MLVEELRRRDISVVFAVASVHNLPLVEAVDRELTLVPVRHEAAAISAADGYARTSGRTGCAITSTGVGAGNAAGSLLEALASRTPLLHVTGQIPTAHLDLGRGFIHEVPDQLGMLRSISAEAHRVVNRSTAHRTIHRALTAAAQLPGPVSVEWPIDLQYQPVERDNCPDDPLETADAPDVAVLLEALARSARPVFWLGGGAVHAGDALRRVVEHTGAAVITTNSGRGSLREDHPLCIGNYGSTPMVQTLLDDADLLVSVGTRFRSQETRDYALRLPRPHVAIDVDPLAAGRVYPADQVVIAHAGPVFTELAAVLARTGTRGADASWTRRVTACRESVRSAQRQALGTHQAWPEVLRALLPEASPVVRDVTIASSTWGNRLLPLHDPRTNVYSRAGAIGQGLATGIGAALGRPDVPTLVLVGDGGLAVHAGELATLAQVAPWLVLLVMDDGGYGVLRNQQRAQGRAASAVDLLTPDHATLAAAYRIQHFGITAPNEVEAALTAAIDERGPVLVHVDLHAFGEMAERFTPPVTTPMDDPVPIHAPERRP